MFGHGVVWADVGNKHIRKWTGVDNADELDTLQDCVIPLLELEVVLQPCEPSKLGRVWGSLPPCSGAGCCLHWLLGKEVCILPETPGWKTSKAGGVVQSQQVHGLFLE